MCGIIGVSGRTGAGRSGPRRTMALVLGVVMAVTSCGQSDASDSGPAASNSVLDASGSPASPELDSPDAPGDNGVVLPSPLPANSDVAATVETRLDSSSPNSEASTSAAVNDVAVAADQRVATAASDGVVAVYDLSSAAEPPASLVHPEGNVDAVDFEADGGRLATGIAERRAASAFDDTVSFWDVDDAERTLHVGGEADEVAGCSFFRNIVEWSHDGAFVTSTSHDFTVSMIDPATGRFLHTFEPHGNTVLDTAISPDDRLLVTSADDSTMRVWDLRSKELVAEHQVTMGGYWSMAFLPGGTELVVSDIVGRISVIDVVSGDTRRQFEGRKQRHGSVAVSADGGIVAAGADDSAVRLWSTDTGEVVGDLVGHDGPVTSIAFFDDGERFVSGSQDGTAIVWRYAPT